MEKRKTRILCVDDHAIVARGLKASIDLEPDLEWAGHESAADDLVGAVDRAKADIVLLDVDMPGADSFKELESLSELRPSIRALMLSAFIRDTYIDAALAAGAWGYVSKSEEFEVILDAVRRIALGAFVFPDDVLQRCEVVDGRLRPKQSSATSSAALTPREVQVLRMIAQGMSTKD
ncbi:MAG: response regulator transcription factor, partial [Planctomycetota bacterium]|nr:response regulator transcription factor [Planctomycetota bacterium]